MKATGICPPPPFLQCPGKPSCPWTDWERQFETFLVAVGGNDFTATQKKVLLLHSMGAEAQRVFHSQPQAIKATGEDDYDRNSAAKVFLRQRSGESTAEYVAELRRLAHNCQFRALAGEMIRDQVVEKTSYEATRTVSPE
ncbi:hypothetical protein O3P69_009932 [Scylla paramamosain]|uniref:Retrotransposon gag domain-containing protein n=1 Tax=Scylla paramamosain TaxID=85552 RepID=A0AAW0SPB3_SCYPA